MATPVTLVSSGGAPVTLVDALGALVSVGGGSSSALRLAANRGEIPMNTTTAATNSTRVENRKFFTLGGADYTELRAVYCGYYVTTSNVETAIGNDQPVQAALEWTVSGSPVTKQWKFGGALTGTIINGVAEYVSDPIYPFEFGLTKFAKNSPFFVRDQRDVTSGQFFNRNPSTNSMTGEGTFFSNGASPSQLLSTGVMTVQASGSQQGRDFGPVCIVGRTVSGQWEIAVGGFGDSIGAGATDTFQPNGSDGSAGGGWAQRALINTNGRSVPFLQMSYAGTGVSQLLANFSLRGRLLKYLTHAYEQYGTNDFGSLGVSTANIIAQRQALWARLKAGDSGIYHVSAIPIFPRLNGVPTDATITGQSVKSGYEIGGSFRDPVNAAIDAALASRTIDSIFDIRKVVQDPAKADQWIRDGVTVAYATPDGTHLQPATSIIVADAFRLLAAAWA